MADDALEIDTDDLERRMEGAMSALRQEFLTLRTGRAAATMLDPVHVDAYGQMTPINQLGTVNVPEPRMLTINIWDRALVGRVEKALRDSGLGINPVVDGTIIRLPIPELNEERRRELTRVAAQYAEHARVAVRNVRRDGMDRLKKGQGGRHERGRQQGLVRRNSGTDRQVYRSYRRDARSQADGNHAGLSWSTSPPVSGDARATRIGMAARTTGKWCRNTSPSSWMATADGRRDGGWPDCAAIRPGPRGCARSCAPVPIRACAT